MVNKKTLLNYAYLLFAFGIIGLTTFLQFKSGGYFWPYAHIAKGVLSGVIICIIFSRIKKRELSINSLLKWSFPLGFLGAFWCCIQLQPQDPIKSIIDTLTLVFGAVVFFSTTLSFSVMRIWGLYKKRK